MLSDALLFQIAHPVVSLVVAVWLLTSVGNSACRRLVDHIKDGKTISNATPIDPAERTSDTDIKAGRIIGSLERVILALGIVVGSWHVLAAVIALKTVSRFKKLDEKEFAEYFLVGSLFSLLWALLITASWMAYDAVMDLNIATWVKGVMHSAVTP